MRFWGVPAKLKDGRTIVPYFIHGKQEDPGRVYIRMTASGQKIYLSNTIAERNKACLTAWFDRRNLEAFVEIVEPGDIIEFERYVYSHYAIFLGASNSEDHRLEEAFIVHFSNLQGSKRNPIRIHVDRLVDVKVTSRVRINNINDVSLNPMQQYLSLKCLVNRIEEFLEKPKPYHALRNNCEHFSSFCRYNEKTSFFFAKCRKRHKNINTVHVVEITIAGGLSGYVWEGLPAVIPRLGLGAAVGLLIFSLFVVLQFVILLYAKWH